MDMVQQLLTNFGINSSIFVLLGLFLGTYAILRVVALGRLTETVLERAKRTEGREHEAAEQQLELGELNTQLDAQLKKAQAEASDLFSQLKNKAQAEQATILKNARDRASQEVKSARDDVERTFNQELEKAQNEVPAIAQQILTRLLTAPTKGKPSAPSSLKSSEVRDG
jgi:F0F1-type ATP synthase membrane subunit b/b'